MGQKMYLPVVLALLLALNAECRSLRLVVHRDRCYRSFAACLKFGDPYELTDDSGHQEPLNCGAW